MRVSFDYDDWRRILIAQDVEYLRCNIFNEGWRVGINYL